MQDKYHLTSLESELMVILWAIKEGTVHDVMSKLPKNRPLAYTTVSTVLRVLEQKNILAVKKNGRQHIYKPLFSKEAYAKHSIDRMVKNVFENNHADMVAHLVDKRKISLKEIEAIEQLLVAKKQRLNNDA